MEAELVAQGSSEAGMRRNGAGQVDMAMLLD